MKFSLMLSALLMAGALCGSAASDSVMVQRCDAPLQASADSAKAVGSPKVYDKVDKMPQYPGGPRAMFAYLSRNLKYPMEARKDGAAGRVILTFVVTEDGSVEDVRERSLSTPRSTPRPCAWSALCPSGLRASWTARRRGWSTRCPWYSARCRTVGTDADPVCPRQPGQAR